MKTLAQHWTNSRPGFTRSGTLFDLPTKIERIEQLSAEMEKPGFWDHQETAQKTLTELKTLRAQVEPVQDLLARLEDAGVLIELAQEEADESARQELENELQAIAAKADQVELLTLLSGKNDDRPCYFSIQAGAGGVDACDFAEMLLRMYLMYFE
ncbi:MAG: PCRF domain-containing protein, partial [Planctomycetota bacterium]